MGLAFPDDQHFPAKPSQLPQITFVASNIGAKLICPVLSVGGRYAIPAPATMLVPEATMDKDDFPWAGKNQVRLPWKIAAMQSKTITEGMR